MRRSAASKARADIVFSGGGTAGHILPALAIANALVQAGHDRTDIAFVGSRRGMEASMIPEAGFAVTLLPGRGIRRTLTLANVTAACGLLAAMISAFIRVALRRPKVIVSVGGYASVPTSVAGILLRVPVVVVNVDVVPGAANRLIGRFAARSVVPSASTDLPRKVVTGVPVRQVVLDIDTSDSGRMKSRTHFGVSSDHLLVVVIGGSLGALRLNDATLALVERLKARSDVTIWHVSGVRDFERLEHLREEMTFEGESHLQYSVHPYEDNLPDLLNSADLVISRAGASTLAEIAILGVPSVLIPLPNSPGDHQRLNAETLASAGAAVIVADAEASAGVIGPVLEELLADPARRHAMAEAARSIGARHATEKIAALIDQVSASTGHRSPFRRARTARMG